MILTKRQRIIKIFGLTKARLDGLITQESLEEAIREIITQEPELPLGIGTTTEVRHK